MINLKTLVEKQLLVKKYKLKIQVKNPEYNSCKQLILVLLCLPVDVFDENV